MADLGHFCEKRHFAHPPPAISVCAGFLRKNIIAFGTFSPKSCLKTGERRSFSRNVRKLVNRRVFWSEFGQRTNERNSQKDSQQPHAVAMEMTRYSGKIVSFSRGYGYGFIEPTPPIRGERNIFVHITDIDRVEGYTGFTLATGEKVTFELAHGEKGTMAANVRDFNHEPFRPRPSTQQQQQQDPPPRIETEEGLSVVVKGVVEQWNDGTGFIRGDNGVRYFVPGENCIMQDQRRCRQLNVGQKVEFLVEMYPSDAVAAARPRACPVAIDVTGPQRAPLYNGTVEAPKPSPVVKKPLAHTESKDSKWLRLEEQLHDIEMRKHAKTGILYPRPKSDYEDGDEEE
jgi:cold shock CspA family protein